MERLTVKRDDGRWALANNDGAKPLEQMEKIPIAIGRLAAYEDSGLTPQEIEIQQIALSQCKPYIDAICDRRGTVLINPIRLKELVQAEKDGRLVAYLPGDKVYDRFWTPWVVESSEIHLIGVEIKHLYRCGHPGTEDYCAMYEDEILTREEAEAALKKREES